MLSPYPSFPFRRWGRLADIFSIFCHRTSFPSFLKFHVPFPRSRRE
nr:MAG TPA: hypothetical protein [Caudoviricetes sp.]